MKPEKRANKMAKYMCNENLWLKKCFFSWKFYPPNHYYCFCCFPIYLPWSDGTGNNDRLYFLGLQNYCRWWLQAMKLKDASPWKKSYDQPRQHIKNQRHYFVNKGLSSQNHGFSRSHVWMWEVDYKRKLSTEELMLLNCGVGEDSWESLGLQGDPSSPS